MKRVIIVGMGSIGIRHARICLQLPDLKVELCDPRQAGLVEAQACLGALSCWSTWERAVASKPDLMIIATPHHLHSEMVCQAMEAGIDVLCEKPMSDSAEGALRMARTASTTGRTLRIGFMLRFQPAIIHLRSLLKEGVLGNLISIRYHIGSMITLENSRSRYQSSLPGALVMDYVHGLDLMLWLTGVTPTGVYARGLNTGNLPLTASPTLFSAIIDFAAPLLGEIHMDYAAKPQLHELLLVGDRAMARLELAEGKIEVRHREENRREEVAFSFDRDELYAQQMVEFLAAVDGGDSTGCQPDEGVLSTLLMQRLLESAREQTHLCFNPELAEV